MFRLECAQRSTSISNTESIFEMRVLLLANWRWFSYLPCFDFLQFSIFLPYVFFVAQVKMLATKPLTISFTLLCYFVSQAKGQVHFTSTNWNGITVNQPYNVTLSFLTPPKLLPANACAPLGGKEMAL